jgi:hypothetical protein
MKNIKTAFKSGMVLATFLLFQNISAQVQTAMATSPEAMAQQQTKYEASALNLDSKQAKDLGEINLLYAQQMMELRKKAANENTKNEVEALKRSHSNKIRSLLSSDKYKQYLALKKEDAKKEVKKP